MTASGRKTALLALDLDGTLLRDDKVIANADVAAIARARAAGMAVTIATGRLAAGTLPFARQLGLTTPMVCADGGLLLDPDDGRVLERNPIAASHAGAAIEDLVAHGLAPFVFLDAAIHCDAAGARHRALVEVWSQEIVVHGSLQAAAPWSRAEGAALTVGMGKRTDVERAAAHLRAHRADQLDTVHFNMSGTDVWAVRSLPSGCDKSVMLAVLAGRLGLDASGVAVVGDWLNDLGMLRYAGRSFAMGQAPEIVREAATDTVSATSATGGGVAEAIAVLLGE